MSMPSYADPPFAVSPDVVLDLPVPPSVNRLKVIDWSAIKVGKSWMRGADAFVYVAKTRAENPLRLTRIPRFELSVILSPAHTGIDLDNGLKFLIDYLRRIQLIENDAPQNMRKITVEWGEAPHGCRVTIRPLASEGR